MKRNLATLAVAVTFALSAQAASVTFTATGTLGGNPEDVSATVTTGAGFITVMLTNLEANPKDVIQSISDFFVTVSGVDTLTGTTSTPTGSLINIAANGSVSNSAAAVAPWGVSISGTTATSTTFLLNDLIGPQLQTIIGPAGAGGVYTNANGSIAGNGPHNPFLDGSATFTINSATVTDATTISAATFSFGTTSGNNLTGTPGGGGGGGGGTVPEPGSIGLMVVGALMLFGGRARHNRRRERREY